MHRDADADRAERAYRRASVAARPAQHTHDTGHDMTHWPTTIVGIALAILLLSGPVVAQ
jgi:hypothetical protein